MLTVPVAGRTRSWCSAVAAYGPLAKLATASSRTALQARPSCLRLGRVLRQVAQEVVLLDP